MTSGGGLAVVPPGDPSGDASGPSVLAPVDDRVAVGLDPPREVTPPLPPPDAARPLAGLTETGVEDAVGRVSRGAIAAAEVVVLDYGGQYSQLIARRVRECGVFSELLPHDVGAAEVARRAPRGLILSGGPASVYAPGAPALDRELLELGIPVLGICYGMQLLVHDLGGRVEQA
ncbi:MAG: hypothetical protein QOE44_2766, partial [Solirubrobacteraceae bacterium]|nr:hypothetical protein [Solirubrobacteraceae bacterium]